MGSESTVESGVPLKSNTPRLLLARLLLLGRTDDAPSANDTLQHKTRHRRESEIVIEIVIEMGERER